MHNDEAVNALKIQALWEKGVYAYDPEEYHGPSLYYSTLPFLWLSPARDFSQLSETTLRLVPMVFGLGLIVLLWWLRDGLGATATLCAGALTALSPAMVFYSRYFIHEMLLVCFTMLVIVAGWRYARAPSLGWAVLGGMGLGLMHATKETFVFPVSAIAVAGLLTAIWRNSVSPSRPLVHEGSGIGGQESSVPGPERQTLTPHGWNRLHLLAGLGAGLIVSVLLFTSFFTHPSGPLDSLRSYFPWLHRARGHSPHIHPFMFYIERLVFFHQGNGPVWTEGLIILLATVGMAAAFAGRGLGVANVWLARFLAFYTILLTLAYSAISYKTPWCMLGFLHGLILLAGVGAAVLFRLLLRNPQASDHTLRSVAQSRLLIAVPLVLALVGGGVHLGWQAWQGSFRYEADRRNPYVYAQTVPDTLELCAQLEALAQIAPQGHEILIKVMSPESDYWPLPWYLRRFQRVGWWDHLPDDPYAPMMIVGQKLWPAFKTNLNPGWSALGVHGLRPGTFLQLYVQNGLWGRYLESVKK